MVRFIDIDPAADVEDTIEHLVEQQGKLRRVQNCAHNARLATNRLHVALQANRHVKEAIYQEYLNAVADFDNALINLRTER